VLLAAKGKAVLLLLANLKVWMFWKTGATMFITPWFYAQSLGWGFAGGLVGLILLHEAGHVWAAHRVGVPVSAPMFIPFMGAFVTLRGRPQSTYHEFIIAAGGPIVGAAGALACIAASTLLEGRAASLARVVGYYALVLNLFNLTPFWILDGKKMLAPVTNRAGLVGALLAAIAIVVSAAYAESVNPIGLLAVAACLGQVGLRAYRAHRAGRRPASALERLAEEAEKRSVTPDEASPRERRTAALVYFVALAALGAAVHLLAGLVPAAGA
jgi:Zn-dependent protease